MNIGDWIQTAAVLAAVAASIIALRIATKDRQLQRELARLDREQARLTAELELAVRLSENLNHGGSTDPRETKRLGAEAMALVSVLGEGRVPRYYRHVMGGRSVDEIEIAPDEPGAETPRWVQWRNEAAVAVQRIAAELRSNEQDTVAARKSRRS